jgi:hypothetical protein
LYEVEGTLHAQGKPLANVQVEFWPEKSGPRSLGLTDAQGHYHLTTDDQRPGAIPGPHRVVLYDLAIYGDQPKIGKGDKDMDQPLKPSRLAAYYSDANRTPLKKTVMADRNVIDLDTTP